MNLLKVSFISSSLVRRCFSMTQTNYDRLRVAVIGQSMFGADTYNILKKDGHDIVGVFTIPDINGKPDSLAVAAEADGVPVFKFKRWRLKGKPIDDVVDQYKAVGAELNVMPFCSQFIPMNVINHPKHGSIVYHPSILPVHRGASAINWTLMSGDKKAGFSIFWADDGLDTGPILLQRETPVKPNDTLDDIYNRFLYPEGVKAMAEAVELVSKGRAPSIEQNHDLATYEAIMKKSNAEIDWDQPAASLHNFIRGNDKIPGAWCKINGEKVTLYGSSLYRRKLPDGETLEIEGLSKPAVVHDTGLIVQGNDGRKVLVKNLQLESGKMIPASEVLNPASATELVLTDEELTMQGNLITVWKGIINREIENDTDFFKAGAGSMDVVRLVEEIKQKLGVSLKNEDIYMNTTFGELMQQIVKVNRGLIKEEKLEVDYVTKVINGVTCNMPHQAFINNEFVDASSEQVYDTINPADESVICQVARATVDDVNDAVAAAKDAFEGGWASMNARDRGTLMYRLADLMEEHKEELATIESIDSGAVKTLALITHVGMSIQTFRYFAGWCDKIHGKTIPINHAAPNRNLTFTKKEPVGVCAIVIPWNYPLMMLAWKMAACLAAGNTMVLKPAFVTPLTALKFAELVVKAGFPKGVINILPGSGGLIGQAMADHPDVRKLGFTGSTPIGKQIMKSAALSNLKKVSLELGGKSPLIIFADCDMDKAVRFGMGSVFFNKGENCIAAGRLFVEDSIHDEFVERVIEEIKKMKIGDPLDGSTDHGPQNHRAHLEKLVEYVEEGVKEGATLAYGGKQVDMPGLYMTPTVLTDVKDHMWIAKEESFGPIMVVSRFDDGDVDGVLASANNVEYGLASGVMTNDVSKAMKCAEKLDAGTCFVNTYNKTDVAAPFGGFKQSGFGKDLGEEALSEYLKTKTVTIEY